MGRLVLTIMAVLAIIAENRKVNPELFPKLVDVVEMGNTLDVQVSYSPEPNSLYQLIMVKLGTGFTITFCKSK